MKYTVVLAWEDKDSVVEWVEARDPEEAVFVATLMATDRDDAWPAAVFEGHHSDVSPLISYP